MLATPIYRQLVTSCRFLHIYGAFLASILVSCRPVPPPSANLASDPLTDKPAELGKTEFKCQAQATQVWEEGVTSDNPFSGKEHILKLASPSQITKLVETEALNLDATKFTATKASITDGPNINNFRVHTFFADKSSLGCEDGLWELQFTSTTAVAHLPRAVTASTGYCWDPRGKSIQIFQRVMFGPKREEVGARISQEGDLKTAGREELEAASIKYSLTCTR